MEPAADDAELARSARVPWGLGLIRNAPRGETSVSSTTSHRAERGSDGRRDDEGVAQPRRRPSGPAGGDAPGIANTGASGEMGENSTAARNPTWARGRAPPQGVTSETSPAPTATAARHAATASGSTRGRPRRAKDPGGSNNENRCPDANAIG